MKKVFLTLLVLISLQSQASAETKADSLSNVQLEEVVVSATRAGENTPLSYTNIGEAELKNNNT
ncbi:MAG: hypothetical protein GX921_00085, partial [Bacteroidales bacterium]|nr:hypothetical protein [Bacteroidales bacterium]